MEATRPQAILFDYGDTLIENVDFDPYQGTRDLLRLAHPQGDTSPEEVLSFVMELMQDLRPQQTDELVELPVQTFQKLVFEHFGIEFPLSPEEVELEFWKASYSTALEPGIVDALTRLERAGIRRGIISNTAFSYGPLVWGLEFYGIDTFFEFLVGSADYGFRKPHKSLFLVAAKKMDLPPEEIWYVGNSWRHDVVGSREAGMTPVWYNRYSRECPEPKSGVLECSHWDEFDELLPD